MPLCPKCKNEYREGFETCSDCGEQLVNELPEEIHTADEITGPEFLISVADGVQADIMESKLRFYGIPVMRKYKESGAYLKIYMGGTPFGVDLYVPGDMLENAKQLIAADAGDAAGNMKITTDMNEGIDNTEVEDNAQSEDEGDSDTGTYPASKRSKVLLALFFVIPFLIYILFLLIKYISR